MTHCKIVCVLYKSYKNTLMVEEGQYKFKNFQLPTTATTTSKFSKMLN